MRNLKLLPLLLLSSCASTPYWTQYAAPVEVRHVVRVDKPGGRDLFGFWNAPAQTIEVRKGLRPAVEACVISHERKHAQGYMHPEARGDFATDCGDGTIL